MLDLGRYEAGVHDCGFHRSLTSDPANHFTPETDVCPVCKGYDQYRRIQQDADEQFRKNLGEKPPPGTPLPSDGRRTYMRLMLPTEVEARRSEQDERARRRT